MKSCLNCEKEFEPRKPKAKYCSDNCRVKYNRKLAKEAKLSDTVTIPKSEYEMLLSSKGVLHHIENSAQNEFAPSNLTSNMIEEVVEQLSKSSKNQSAKVIYEIVEEPTYDSQWFRDAFRKASDAKELDNLVKLMYKKIVGAWSQGQLKEYAQEIFNDKFNF